MSGTRLLAFGGIIGIMALAILLTDAARPPKVERSPTGAVAKPSPQLGIARRSHARSVPEAPPMVVDVIREGPVAPLKGARAPAPARANDPRADAPPVEPAANEPPTPRAVPTPVGNSTASDEDESDEDDEKELIEKQRWPLDKDGIQSAMREWLPELQECYEAWLEAKRQDESLDGKVVATFEVKPDKRAPGTGRVANVSIGSSTVNHAMLESCVLNVAVSLQFEMDAAANSLKVNYPITFEAAEKGSVAP